MTCHSLNHSECRCSAGSLYTTAYTLHRMNKKKPVVFTLTLNFRQILWFWDNDISWKNYACSMYVYYACAYVCVCMCACIATKCKALSHNFGKKWKIDLIRQAWHDCSVHLLLQYAAHRIIDIILSLVISTHDVRTATLYKLRFTLFYLSLQHIRPTDFLAFTVLCASF